MSAKPVQAPTPTKDAAPTAPAAAAPGNVDKIRDIIFGGQMKEYESRFERLEETVRREVAELREGTRKRLDALESSVRREMEALASQDKVERQERMDALERVSREVKEQGDSLLRKLSDGDTRHSDAERAIRGELAAKSSELADEIERRAQELASLVDRRFRELGVAKTDRAALSSLFTEVAMRLKGDFDLPSGE
jgi:rRNA maturation endonuclease Nob1